MEQKEPNSEYPITFGFRKIDVEQFAIIQEAYKQNEEVTLTVNTAFSIQPEWTQVGSHVTIKFLCGDNPFLIVQVACHVGIDPKSWKKWESEDKTIVIPAFFATHLVVLTVGTLRGILHSKT
ncbi:MAG TPA: hypothetical protein VLB84_17550, partial [Bacteroidia bacterium]|nr:hypothetical protein [Bacteroidia bacterium]